MATKKNVIAKQGDPGFFTGEIVSLNGTSFNNPYALPESEVKKEDPRTGALGFIADRGIDLVKGAVSVPEAVVGLGSMVSGGRIGQMAEGIGFRPKEAKEILSGFQSEGYQDKQRQFQEAEGVVAKLGAAVTNPSLIAGAITESLPLMGAGGVLARGALTLAPRAGIAAVAGGEGLVSAGSAAETIRQQTADGRLTGEQAALAGATGLAVGGFGLLGAKIAQKLGIADVDSLVAGVARSGPEIQKSAVRRVLEGAVSEGLLEELPQSVAEQVLQNQALGRPLSEGVDGAAVMGALSGAAMGGGVNLMSRQKPEEKATPGKPPEAQPITTPAEPVPTVGTMSMAANLGTTLTNRNAADLLTPKADPFMANVKAMDQQRQENRLQDELANDAMAKLESAYQDDLQALNVQRFANQPRIAEEPQAIEPQAEPEMLPFAQEGDILKGDEPFKNQLSASKQAKKTPGDVVQVFGGWVVRPAKAEPQAVQEIQPITAQTIDVAAPLAIESVANEQNQEAGTQTGQIPAPAQDQEAAPMAGNEAGGSIEPPATGSAALESAGVKDPASWVIREKATGKVVMETFDKKKVDALNTTKYEAVPIREHLESLNKQPTDQPKVTRLGVNNIDLSDGGKPFKTQSEAKKAQKQQPMMRVLPTPDKKGYMLVDKTPKQLAAEAERARKMALPSVGEKGKPMAAHEFIASEGGLNQDADANIGFGRNPKIGNRWLYARKGSGKGMTLGQAAEKLWQNGYSDKELSESEVAAMMKRSFEKPTYTAEGYERIAQAEAETRFEDYMAAQAEAEGGEFDPFPLPDEYTDDMREESGYDDASLAEIREIEALIAQAEAEGIDTEAIREDIARKQELTDEEYRAAVRAEITKQRAMRASSTSPDRAEDSQQGRQDAAGEIPESGGEPAWAQGTQGNEPSLEQRPDGTLAIRGEPKQIRESLTQAGIPAKSILPMDGGILVGKTQAENAKAALQPAESKWDSIDSEQDAALKERRLRHIASRSKDDADLVGILDRLPDPMTQEPYVGETSKISWDVYNNPAASESTKARAKKIYDAATRAVEGDKPARQGSPASPDLFNKGDDAQAFTLDIPLFGRVPYRASEPVKAPEGGKVLSSEILTTKTKLRAQVAKEDGLPDTVYAWRVSLVQGLGFGAPVASVQIEAMHRDSGRTKNGEVIAYFKQVDYDIAPAAVQNKARKVYDDFVESLKQGDTQDLLTQPTREDILAQQDRVENAQALDDKAQIDREVGGFTLQAQNFESRVDNTGDMFGGPTVDDFQKSAQAQREKSASPQPGDDLFSAPRAKDEPADTVTTEPTATKEEAVKPNDPQKLEGQQKEELSRMLESLPEDQLRQFSKRFIFSVTNKSNAQLIDNLVNDNSYSAEQKLETLKALVVDDGNPIFKRSPAEGISPAFGWELLGEQSKKTPGYASEASAKIAISKNEDWKSKAPVIVEFNYWDGALNSRATTRYAIAARAIQPTVKAEEAKPATPAAKIDDFGEKIGGAKKDTWSGFKDQIGAVKDEDIAQSKLSEIWPSPDYQKLIDEGMNAESVAVLRSLRDQIPAKPRASYKLRNWVELVKEMRNLATELLESKQSAKSIVALFGKDNRVARSIGGRAELYEALGHEKSLDGIRFGYQFFNLYRGRENVGLWIVEREAAATAFSNWPQELATGNTKEEALANFKKKYDELDAVAAVKKASYDIFTKSSGKSYFVGKKIGRNVAELAGPFNSLKEARDYRQNNLAELDKKLEKYKEIPRERRDTNAPRVGEDMRNGQDVTPEMFSETFGFRGVEFGNWVEQKRRQKDLNDAFDSLMDMAAVLEIPAKAISLNGELALAFGARGSGGMNPAAAHYEPGKIVINLTKREGAGSLGHEWWHALDNYFSRMRGKASGMTTEALDVSLASRGSAFELRGNVRREMIEAFGGVVKAIKSTKMKERSAKLDAKRSKEYWTTGDELSARAFESYLIAKLQDQNASNDYLANVVDQKVWDTMASLGIENQDSYPYPTETEMPSIRAGFDKFFQVIETKETDKGVQLYTVSDLPTTTAPAYYSALSRHIGGLNVKALPVGAWKDALKGAINQGKIKEDEVEATGIREWLDLQQGKVTKEQVTEYLDANGVQVEEVTLGSSTMTKPLLEKLKKRYGIEADFEYGEYSFKNEDGDDLEYYDMPQGARDIADDLARFGEAQDETKYNQYTLPGGENYREVLLTLPTKIDGELPAGFSIREFATGRWGVFGPGPLPENRYGSGVNREAALRTFYNYHGQSVGASVYKSGHWDQPNVLAHIRVNDRVDADGKRVLFVEEVQSDWGQDGKKKGFASSPMSDAEIDAITKEVDSVGGFANASPELQARAQEANRQLVGSQIPIAPFVTNTDKWLTLALKRIVTMAAQEGYDRVAFVNGDQSAERYDLSRQIDRLQIVKSPRGTYSIGMYKNERDGDENLLRAHYDIPAEKLEDYVGKQIAKQAIDGQKDFTGDGLKIGGEGMKAFYDKIVPNTMNALLKKLGGGKVESVELTWQNALDVTIKETQPGFTITPELRKIAQGGLPLFTQPSASLMNFRKLTGKANASTAKADAEQMLGFSSPVPILTKSDQALADKRVPMWYDLTDKAIYYNTAYDGHDRANDAQWMTEEIMHAVDNVGGNRIISASAETLRKGGEPRTELEAAIKRSRALYSVLRYPLDMQEKFSEDRIVAELFARTAVIYNGFPDLLKAAAPKTYEVFHGFFQRRDGAVRSEARRDPADRGEEPRGLGTDRASITGTAQADRAGEKLDKFREDIANALGGKRGGVDGDFGGVRLEAVADAAANLFNDVMTSQKRFNWWNNTIGTQYQKATQDKHFKRVFDATQNYISDVSRLANDAADLARDILPRLENFRDVIKDVPGIDKNRTTAKDLEAIAKPIFQGTLADTRVYQSQELKSVFGLTDKQIGLYKQFRDAVDKSLDDLTTSTIAKMVTSRTLIPKSMVNDYLEQGDHEGLAKLVFDAAKSDDSLKPLANQVMEASDRAKKLKGEGYAPLMRFGQYAVSVRDAVSDDLQGFYLFESQMEANKFARSIDKGESDVTQSVMSQEDYKLLGGVSPESLELFGDILEKAGVFDSRDEVFQTYLRNAVDNRSAMKRMLERKGYPGYSMDARRVLASFLTSNARLASKNLHFTDMLEAAENVPKSKGDVRDEAIKLVEYVKNPTEEAARIRGLLFVQYIGGSMASALVNMTQSLTMTWPYLSQFSSPAKSAKTIAAAMKAAAGRPTGELGDALARAEQSGIVQPQEIHHLNAEAMATFGANPAVQKALFVWGSLFSMAEQFNRRAAFIAGYNSAPAGKDPYAFGVQAVEETQGVYNKGNRPNWARGALGATLFTFKQFSISYIEFLTRLPNREKALAMAILMMAAGAEGLPFADDLDDVIDTIAQRLGYAFNSKEQKRRFIAAHLGEGAAEFILKGASAGLPIDISGRMGMANLLPGTGMLRSDTAADGKMREALQILGPAGGVVQDAMKGEFMPVALRNLRQSIDMFQTGMYRDDKGRKIVDTTAADALWKSIGLQPSGVAQAQLGARVANQNIRLAKVIEAEIADEMAQARFEKDTEALEAARQRLRDWNVKNPEARIAINQAQIMRRLKEIRLTRQERVINAAPKEMRQYAASVMQ